MISFVIAAALTVAADPPPQDPLVAPNAVRAFELFVDGVRLSDLLGIDLGQARPLLRPTPRYTDDPATNLAIELLVARVERAEMTEQFAAENPAIARQETKIATLRKALRAMRRQGFPVDRRRLRAAYQDRLARTQAALDLADRTYEPAHPILAQLRDRAAALKSAAPKRGKPAAKKKPQKQAQPPVD